MPLFHVAGCLGGVLLSLYAGCTLIPLVAFDPVKQLELLESERATLTFNVPTMLIAMLNHPRFLAGEFNLCCLRDVITGATPVPVVVMEQVKNSIGANCTIVFGLTESSGTITQTI